MFKYRAKEEIPAEHQSFYIERDGAFVLDAEGTVEKTKLDEFRNTNVSLLKQLDEAAWELLEVALDDWVDDMKGKVEADLLTAAQAVCVGIVAGLYNARNATSDGVLDWAPDFSAEHAGYVLQEFLQLCRYK